MKRTKTDSKAIETKYKLQGRGEREDFDALRNTFLQGWRF
jgi:hypothetical protein